MRSQSLAVRAYLWAIGAACATLVVTQCVLLPPWAPLWRDPSLLLQVVVFVALAYAGERTALRINQFVDQSLATPVHIAVILLFPRPLPLLIALVAVSISQIVYVRLPLYKRIFNICHVTLTVGLTAALFHLIATPVALLRPGHILAAVPGLIALIGLYYVFDVGIMVALIALLDVRSPRQVWRRTYYHTLTPELSTSSIGILAAMVWRDDPILLLLFALPMQALRVAFRAIARAEEQALALRRRGDGLEAILAAGQRVRLPQTPEEIVRIVAEAARAVAGASAVTAYLPDADDPMALRRVAVSPAAAEPGPARMPIPARGDGIDEDDGALVVPLTLDGSGVLGLLRIAPADTDDASNRDALAILATQGAIALQNAHLYRDAQEGRAAREADRLKSELLNTVSHELRTPLGAIKGFASSLLTYGTQMDEENRADALRMIEDGADRLTELVDNLLSAQGLEAGALLIRREPLDAAAVARAVVAEMSRRVETHALAVHAPTAAPLISGDERRLRQVLLNLIGNAIKYSPDGGRIDVTMTASHELVELRVTDEGLGIPADQLEHIFERFHRVDNTNTRRIYGTGLGLTIVRGLVEAHGGRVWAESLGPGRGSTFVVHLPAAQELDELDAALPSRRDAAGGATTAMAAPPRSGFLGG